jgi:hypothetical protein
MENNAHMKYNGRGVVCGSIINLVGEVGLLRKAIWFH